MSKDMAHSRLLKDPATINSRIFIGHLQTDDLNRSELEDHFAKYGAIVGSSLNRGFGFIQFETEQSAVDAISNEDGSMFKGRRIDVKPAKKDSASIISTGSVTGGTNNSVSSAGSTTAFGLSSDSFSNNASFGGSTAGSSNFNNSNFPNDNQFTRCGVQNAPFGDKVADDQFNSSRASNSNQTGPFVGNRNNLNQLSQNQGENGRGRGQRGGKGRRRENSGIIRGLDGNLDRGICGGMDRGIGGPMDRGMGGMGSGLAGAIGGGLGSNISSSSNTNLERGLGGGLSRDVSIGVGLGLGNNLNRASMGENLSGSNYRDRSPLGRSGRIDDNQLSTWELNKSGNMRGGYNEFGPHKSHYDDFKLHGSHSRDGPSFGVSTGVGDYPPAAAEKNDCEIIVVNKTLTEYAEIIESRLKKLGLTVDLLFPNEDVPLSRVLGNIASRGCLYAVVITQTNKDHHSLTLNILHGLPQEHRNMPVEDAISLVMRDFKNYKTGGRPVPLNSQTTKEYHPDAIQVLLNMLADNLQLTVLQYERVIKYLEIKREEQVQFELGEDAKDLGPSMSISDPKQAELQSRILNILNSSKSGPTPPLNTSSSTAAPSPVPPPAVSASTTSSVSPTGNNTVTPSPLLNDPTVQKALDSLLQGNLLKNIGDQPIPTTSATPLFAAFPNINRF